jgi:hypothetical protein
LSTRFSYSKESIISGKSVCLKLQVNKGIIVQCEVLIGKLPVSNIEDAIKGLRYNYTEIANRLNEVITQEGIEEIDVDKLALCFF